MRELNECKAEIFRRSQQRIRIRKQARKGILAGCILLVLCAAVLIWPETPIADNRQHPPYDGIGALQSSAMSTGVCVYGFGVQKQITDPERTEQIQKRICSLLAKDDPAGPSDGPLYGGPTDSLPLGKYTIFIQSNGEGFRYTLIGNTLSCTQNGQSVELTDAQLESLKEILGLKEPGKEHIP